MHERFVTKFNSSPFMLFFTLAVVATTFSLARWQWLRAEQKSIILKSQAKDIHPLVDIRDGFLPGERIQISNVIVLGEGAWLLDNRIVDGQAGYDVLSAIHAPVLKQPILVNFGWVKAGKDRNRLPEVNLSSPIQSISITIANWFHEPIISGKNEQSNHWPKRVFHLTQNEVSHTLQTPIMPVIGYVENASDFSFVFHYQPSVMPPEKHHAYSLQWLLIGIAAIVIYVAAAYKRSPIPHAK